MQKSANTYWSREYSSVDFFDKTKTNLAWLKFAILPTWLIKRESCELMIVIISASYLGTGSH